MPMPHGRFGRRTLITATAGAVLAATLRAARADAASIGIGYLRWAEQGQTISLLDKPPRDDGLAGAKLAISDNNTTGQFIGQRFELSDTGLRADDDPVATLAMLSERGIALIVTDVPADLLLPHQRGTRQGDHAVQRWCAR